MIPVTHNPIELIYIPQGKFLIGTSDEQIRKLAEDSQEAREWQLKERFMREQPQHILEVNDYWIGQYPVTVGEYRQFLHANGYTERCYWTESGWKWVKETNRRQPDHWEDPMWTRDDRLPVIGVSWYEAYAYSKWLKFTTRIPYRLPTEAEWEKAARGNDARLYPWGNTISTEHANLRLSGLGRTLPIGSHSPTGDSPYGCCEMVGNISEWTSSQFLPYPYSLQDGREIPSGDTIRVIRGASWFSPKIRARTAARGMNDPWFTDHDVGFRLAADAVER